MEQTQDLTDHEFVNRIELTIKDLRHLPNLQEATNRLLELAKKGLLVEKEADWLADKLVELCQHIYDSDCPVLYDPTLISRKFFREAAQCQTR